MTQKPIGLKMDIFLSVIEVLHVLAFKVYKKVWKPWHNFPFFSNHGIIKDFNSIWYYIVMVAEKEKVNRNIVKCKYALNGLSFNIDDA